MEINMPGSGRQKWRAATPWVVALLACALIGAMLLVVDPLFVIAGLAVLLVAGAVVSQPYYGVLLYIMLLYVRPAELYPVLAPLRLTLLGVLLLAGAYVLQVLVYRNVKPVRSAPLAAMGLFFLVMIISSPQGMWRGGSLEKTMEVARIVFMTYLIVHLVDSAPRLRGFMATLVFAMALLSTMIVIRFYTQPWTRVDNGGSSGIGEGFLGDGNDYSLAQNVILPWALALFLSSRNKIFRALVGYALFIGVWCVFVTYSRGAFLGLMAMFLTLYVLWMYRTGKWAIGLVAGIIGLTAIVAAFLAFAPPDYTERIMGITQYEQDESAMGRIVSWRTSWRMFKDHPFFGVGPYAFTTASGIQYNYGHWLEAHSVFFQILGEMGMFGIATLYGMVVVIVLTVRKLGRVRLANARENLFYHSSRRAVYLSIVAWLVSSMFLSVGYYPHLFILVMLSTCLNELGRRPAPQPLATRQDIDEEEIALTEESP